ncbi:MAG: hypothetical protein U5Q44_11055 [Dehalococcoidia bacterium]|nr:hypothetical protein [Dehalococcoidia bacterium]
MRTRFPLLAILFASLVFAACDAVGGEEVEPTASLTGDSPSLEGPASRYAPFVEELPGDFEVNPPETFALTDDIWSRVGPFESGDAGQQFIDEHGFIEGYRAHFNPDGLLAGVASDGRYYVTVETYLFDRARGCDRGL